jgi:hypothetical protein
MRSMQFQEACSLSGVGASPQGDRKGRPYYTRAWQADP